MYDRKWHSDEEMRQTCGKRFAVRLHELRSAKWGSWATQRAKGSEIDSQPIPGHLRDEYWYRLDPQMLTDRAGEAALLASGDESFLVDAAERAKKVDPFSKIVKPDLSIADAVFLLGLVKNSADLRDPRTKVSWNRYFAITAVKLSESLPDNFQKPTDIFDPNEED